MRAELVPLCDTRGNRSRRWRSVARYSIEYAESVANDLKKLRAYDQRRILDAIDQQLADAPSRSTKNKKLLVGLKPPWEREDLIWELRIGEYRVFYDVVPARRIVTVRAVRRKLPHQTTEEIL